MSRILFQDIKNCLLQIGGNFCNSSFTHKKTVLNVPLVNVCMNSFSTLLYAFCIEWKRTYKLKLCIQKSHRELNLCDRMARVFSSLQSIFQEFHLCRASRLLFHIYGPSLRNILWWHTIVYRKYHNVALHYIHHGISVFIDVIV